MTDVAFSLPTGTVTFLLTDVEGSSRRWERAPEAMASAIPRHYELIDAAIARHGGVRPVEQGEGDSVVGAFSRASDAVAAAVDAQIAMSAETWPEGADLRVRMAIHTGEAQLRDARNYFGQTIIRCARIRAIGHGGQILVSDAAATVLGGHGPEGADLVDLGVHRLKDLGRPERVWQVYHPAVAAEFPPLRSLDTFRHNLPVELTPLVGRRREVSEVAALLGRERLVTLTGSGGVGKTRLAGAVAAELVDSFAGGAWWVELAAVVDGEGVARAVLAALGASETSGSLAQQVAVELGDAPVLLVLDNCEHLVQAAADLVAAVLTANRSVTILTTSREPLSVPGEVTWRVPSLAVPSADDRHVDLGALSQFDAVRLFVDRARRARPSFTIDESSAPAVAQICHRLDGVPLAIELAAARCRQLSADQIAAALDDRFRLLTGGARTVMARQQTLQASIEWSHDLLDDGERRVFRRLGVFVGPFPLEGAEAVASAPGDIDAVAVFDVLSRLVDKSLIATSDGVDGGPRYRLLESLRAYALERARTEGELPSLRDAHARWLVDWVSPVLENPSDAMVDLVDELHDNVVAALEWTAGGDVATGLELVYAVGRPWQALGRGGAALAVADRLLFAPGAEEVGEPWAYAASALAVLYLQSGRLAEFFDLLDRIERIAGEHDNDYLAAVARWFRSLLGKTESEVLAARARERGIVWVEALAMSSVARHQLDDPESSEELVQEALRLSEVNGYLRGGALLNVAILAAARGDFAAAIDASRQILAQRSPAMGGFGVQVLSTVGVLAGDLAALEEAAQADRRARLKAPEMALPADIVGNRLALARGEARGGVDPALAGGLTPQSPLQFGWALWFVCREAIDGGGAELVLERLPELARPTPVGRAALAAVRGAATRDEAHWHDALAAAASLGLRPIVVDALEGLADGASRAGNHEVALRLLGAAERLRDEIGYRWRFVYEQERVDAIRAAAPPDVGAEREGGALDWRDAVAFAARAHGSRKRPSTGWESLTPTEERVVALVVDGLTNPQIAEKLLMGRATVKTHLEHIYAKLGTRTRTELAAAAARRGRG